MQFFTIPVWPAGGTVGNYLVAASPQVGWTAAAVAAAPVIVCAGFVVAMMLIAVVVCPAVWSRQPGRRKAAQAVLKKILGTLVGLVRAWRR